MLCKDNRKHIEDIEPEYIKGIKFHYVERMSDVLEHALGIPAPKPSVPARKPRVAATRPRVAVVGEA
jgi:ATP-dependent Lon protease